jgi:hypothetical protein
MRTYIGFSPALHLQCAQHTHTDFKCMLRMCFIFQVHTQHEPDDLKGIDQ